MVFISGGVLGDSDDGAFAGSEGLLERIGRVGQGTLDPAVFDATQHPVEHRPRSHTIDLGEQSLAPPGQPVVVRFAVKPTSSILSPRKTITIAGEETEIVTKGRHDPCVGIRAVPVGEAMMACVLADHFLRHRGQVGG